MGKPRNGGHDRLIDVGSRTAAPVFVFHRNTAAPGRRLTARPAILACGEACHAR